MNLSSSLAFAAATFCGLLVLATVIRKRLSVATASFLVGMLLFGFESIFTGISFQATSPDKVAFWQTLGFLTKSLLPGTWICFSLTYSRGNYREFLARSRFILGASFLLPLFLLPAFQAPFIE